MHPEIEIKFRLEDAERLRRKLRDAGADFKGHFREENYFCDDDAGGLKATRRVLRLRRSTSLVDAKGTVEQRLTYKEPLPGGEFKARAEAEIAVDDLQGLLIILEHLGYAVRFSYEKEREQWTLGEVIATIDTLPLGQFCELEGSPDEIRRVAGLLGFDLAKGIDKSYLTLLAEQGSSDSS